MTRDEIIRVVATVDPFDVGYETPVIIGLKVQRSKLDKVAKRLSDLPQVRYVGAWDLVLSPVGRRAYDVAQRARVAWARRRGGIRDAGSASSYGAAD